MRTRGQVAIEYILLLGGVLVLTAVATVFLQDTIFKQQAPGIQNKTDTIKDLAKSLETPGTSTPRPTNPPAAQGTGITPTPPAGSLPAGTTPTPAAASTGSPAPSSSATPATDIQPTPNACTTQNGECRLQGSCPSNWLVADPDGVARLACGSGKLEPYECCLVGAPTPTPTLSPGFNQKGNTLISDNGNYRVIEVDSNKNIVWKYPEGPKTSSTLRPLYATRLANGNTLIANGNAVLEVDSYKNIVWAYPSANQPFGNRYVTAERLPNGNTLISDADYYNNNPPAGYGVYKGRIIEVKPDKNIAWEYTTEIEHDYILPGYENKDYAGKYYKSVLYPSAAFRLSNGNTLITDSGSDRVIEVDPAKQIVWNYGPATVPVHDYLRGSASKVKFAVRLPNGNTLVTNEQDSNVTEFTPGKTLIWDYKKASQNDQTRIWGPTGAVRLQNGNTLISERQNSRVIEVSPQKTIVWAYGTAGTQSENGLSNPQTAFRIE